MDSPAYLYESFQVSEIQRSYVFNIMKNVLMIGRVGFNRILIMIYTSDYFCTFFPINVRLFYTGCFTTGTTEQIYYKQGIIRTITDICQLAINVIHVFPF